MYSIVGVLGMPCPLSIFIRLFFASDVWNSRFYIIWVWLLIIKSWLPLTFERNIINRAIHVFLLVKYLFIRKGIIITADLRRARKSAIESVIAGKHSIMANIGHQFWKKHCFYSFIYIIYIYINIILYIIKSRCFLCPCEFVKEMWFESRILRIDAFTFSSWAQYSNGIFWKICGTATLQ